MFVKHCNQNILADSICRQSTLKVLCVAPIWIALLSFPPKIPVGFWAIKLIHTYGAWSLTWTKPREVVWRLCAIYCLPQILAFNSYFFDCTEHRLDVFIGISIITVWSCSGEVTVSSEAQLTFFLLFCFLLLSQSDWPSTGHSLFRISPNYFQPFNKSPPFGFKTFQCVITPASKKYALFLMTFIPK